MIIQGTIWNQSDKVTFRRVGNVAPDYGHEFKHFDFTKEDTKKAIKELDGLRKELDKTLKGALKHEDEKYF